MDLTKAIERVAGQARRGEIDAVLIAGPTASGKSALALDLAKKLGGSVINADSMQVYRDLRVLSARPTIEEELRAEHLLYGFVPAGREYSVGDYLRDCAPVLAALEAAGRIAIVVGGTGLYFRALSEGLVQTPDIPREIRARWEAAAASGDNVHAALAVRDPETAGRLSPADLPRILRALEVFEATGLPIAHWRSRGHAPPLLAPGRWAGLFLDPPRDALFARIDRRFEAMMAEGALDEVRRIAALCLSPNRGVMKAHGVPHLIAHLAGALTRDEAIALGQRDTRRYAKRQLTWARKFMAEWTPVD